MRVLCDKVRGRGERERKRKRQLIFTMEVASENTTQTTEFSEIHKHRG